MRKHKYIEDGYIIQIGEGGGGVEIGDEEYAHIMEAIQNRPTPPEGYDYRLKADLTWELCTAEPAREADMDDEITGDEALNIIMGGEDI